MEATSRFEAGIFSTVTRAIVLATVLVAGAGAAQAADSTDHISPPSASDVALLRGLLALQHPTLRQAGAAVLPAPAVIPAVTTEPNKQDNKPTEPATEGEACARPGSDAIACAKQAGMRASFRASLERAVAVASFDAKF